MMARIRKLLAHPRLPWLVLALAVVASMPSLFAGFQADDVMFHEVVESGRQPAWDLFDVFRSTQLGDGNVAQLRAQGTLPWWTHDSAHLYFFRPLASLSIALDNTLWPDAAWLMHAQNIAWYAALVLVCSGIFRRIAELPHVAGLALLMFALDDSHALSVGWISGRNTVMAATLGLAGFLAWLRWRKEAWQPGAVLGPTLFAVGLLASPGALATGAYFLAYAVVLDEGAIQERLLRLWPLAVIAVAWRVAHVMGGYGANGLQLYTNPGEDGVGFVVATFSHALVLCGAQLSLPFADAAPLAPTAIAVFAAVVVVGFLIAVRHVLRDDPVARFFALGGALSTLPFGVVEPQDRLLIATGLGAFGLIAAYLYAPPRGDRVTWSRRGVSGVLIVLHLVLAPVLFVPQLFATDMLQAQIDHLDQAMPLDPELSDRTVVIVQMPIVLSLFYLRSNRVVRDAPYPAHLLALYAGTSPLDVERVDERTLEVRPERGYLANAFEGGFRSRGLPFAAGEQLTAGPTRIEVVEVTLDGRPALVRFEFAHDLDEVLMYRSLTGGTESWSPPAVGETVTLEGAALF